MANLKNQQKKLLTREITKKTMEYFIGLNEHNGKVMNRTAEKVSAKLVKKYMEAIRSQHREMLKASEKNEMAAAPDLYQGKAALLAS